MYQETPELNPKTNDPKLEQTIKLRYNWVDHDNAI